MSPKYSSSGISLEITGSVSHEIVQYSAGFCTWNSAEVKIFYIMYSRKVQKKIHCRYETPREELREAHGCLAVGWKGYLVASSVYAG
jgi:hypothetical protein